MYAYIKRLLNSNIKKILELVNNSYIRSLYINNKLVEDFGNGLEIIPAKKLKAKDYKKEGELIVTIDSLTNLEVYYLKQIEAGDSLCVERHITTNKIIIDFRDTKIWPDIKIFT